MLGALIRNRSPRFRSSDWHAPLVPVSFTILLAVSALMSARAYEDQGVEVDRARGEVLEVVPGGKVTYHHRLADPQPGNATIPQGETWWIMIRVDGERRGPDAYRGLRWNPSVGWEFATLGGAWRSVSITAEDDAVVGTTVVFAHEILYHDGDCPVHDAAPLTVKVVASISVDRNGGDNERNDGGNGDGNNNGGNGGNNNNGGNGGSNNDGGNGGGGNGNGSGGSRDGLPGQRPASGAQRVEPPPPHGTKSWLRRLGGAAAFHVMDAVDERIRCAKHRHAGPGASVNLPGRWRCGPRLQRRLSLVIAGHVVDDRGQAILSLPAGVPLGTRGHAGSGRARSGLPRGRATRMSMHDVLAGSAFHLAPGSEGGGPGLSFWGRGSISRVDAREGVAAVDGTVGSATMGVDFAADRLVLGLALSSSDGDGTISHAGSTHETSSSLTGFFPYAHLGVTERLTVWATTGAGTGTMTLTKENDEPLETRVGMRALATGSRMEIRPPTEPGDVALAIKGDALLLRVDSSESAGIAGVGANSTRFRVALEGSTEFLLEEKTLVSPFLEVGLRHDGGHASSGHGVELGGGVRLAAPEIGLTAELGARGLIAHAIDGYEELGATGSVRYDPTAGSERGASFTISSSGGPISASGLDALWRREMSPDSLSERHREDETRVDAEFGYGFPVLGGTATGTPWAGVSVSEGQRSLRLGYRVRLRPSIVAGVVGSLQRGAADGASSGHAIMLQLAIR